MGSCGSFGYVNFYSFAIKVSILTRKLIALKTISVFYCCCRNLFQYVALVLLSQGPPMLSFLVENSIQFACKLLKDMYAFSL